MHFIVDSDSPIFGHYNFFKQMTLCFEFSTWNILARYASIFNANTYVYLSAYTQLSISYVTMHDWEVRLIFTQL